MQKAAGYQRVIRIGVAEQATDGEEDFGHREGRGPLRAQDVQADCAVAVDVGVVYASGECKFRGFEWVVRGEVDVEEEHPALKWGVCGAQNGCLRWFFYQEEDYWRVEINLPVEGVVPYRAGTALCWWVIGDVLQLLVDPLESHLRWVGLDWGWEGGSGALTSSVSALQQKCLLAN